MTDRHDNQRRLGSVHRPWDGQRGMSPLSIALRLEREVQREMERDHNHPIEVLRRSTPKQIAEASRGASTPREIAAAWDKLRKAVST